jgi:hypothetical protein
MYGRTFSPSLPPQLPFMCRHRFDVIDSEPFVAFAFLAAAKGRAKGKSGRCLLRLRSSASPPPARSLLRPSLAPTSFVTAPSPSFAGGKGRQKTIKMDTTTTEGRSASSNVD